MLSSRLVNTVAANQSKRGITKLGQREIFKVKTNQTPEKKCKKEAHKLEEEIKRKMKTIQEIIKEANTVKREANAVKKEPNIVKKEDKTANPVKQEANVQVLETISQHDKGTPIVVSKLNQDEVDSPEESQLELNTLMSHVLEKELRNVVIQIWKCLPDAATADVERFVAERLRDGASEEIKNVLGLNVTKRILNVHNPLFVKIQFSGRPENGLLSKFLQTYNITSFKRIDRESNTFAAKLDTISAFDNICTAKDLKCGSAHLTVTPCYKFKNCPNNLNTVYANTTECENYLEEEKSEKASDSFKNNDTNVAGDVNKDLTDKKQDQDKPKQEETSTIDKSKENKTKAQKISKPINKNKSDKAKSDKAVIKKTDKANKIKITTNNSIEYDDDMFEEVSEMDPEFDDEMNDEEILALISGGVVLDECIGSDQE